MQYMKKFHRKYNYISIFLFLIFGYLSLNNVAWAIEKKHG